MTAQDRVYESFPDAEARQEPAIFEHGMICRFRGLLGHIYRADFDAEELGRGRSEIEAWADAAGLRGNQAA